MLEALYTVIIDGKESLTNDIVNFLSVNDGKRAEVYGKDSPRPLIFYSVPDGNFRHTWICAIPKAVNR